MIRVPVTKTVIEKVKVPVALLADCATPDLDTLQTTGDVEQALGESIVSLQKCNTDKERIRMWQDTE